MGTLTTEEAEVLRVEDPEKYELHRPFTEDECERIFAGVRIRLSERAGRRRLARGMIVLVAAALVLAGVGAWLLLTHGATSAGVGVLLISGPFAVVAFAAYSAQHAWHPRDSTRRALLELEIERRNDMLRRLIFARVVAVVFCASGTLPLWFATSGWNAVTSAGNAVFRMAFWGWVFWVVGRRCTQARREREDITAQLKAEAVDAKSCGEPADSTQGPR